MKYAIIGDLHGKDLSDLEKALNFENPEVLICTGDFDQTKTIHQFIDLENKFIENGKKVIKVAGNHDHAILTNLRINSGTMKKQGKTFYDLCFELEQDPIVKEYIEKLVLKTNYKKEIFLDEDKFKDQYKTIIMHGALDGFIIVHPARGIGDLWTRLLKNGDLFKNFNAMKENNYRIMIRGHDHKPIYSYMEPNNFINIYQAKKGDKFELDKDKIHTINPGALFDGFFATIDTSKKKVPVLKYHQL